MNNYISKIKKTLNHQPAFLILAIILVAGMIWFYESGNFQDSSLDGGGYQSQRMASVKNDYYDSDTSTSEGSKSIANENSKDIQERKNVKDGSLSLVVEKTEEAASNIRSIAESFDGFVGNYHVYEIAGGVKSGTIIIRVPSGDFYKTIDEIKKIAVKVESETIGIQDVTDQFIDLEARLRNYKAEEERYLDILKNAKTVEDILKVSSRLTEIRGNIEVLEGKLKYLNNQVDMAEINISLVSKADVEVFGVDWQPLYIIKQAFKSMLSGLINYVDLMIGFIFNLPVILLWLVTLGLCFWVIFKALKWFGGLLRK